MGFLLCYNEWNPLRVVMPRQNKFIIGHLNLIYEAITSILFIDNYSIMISAYGK